MPPCRRGCGERVPLPGVTCARCTREDVERTPRTEAGKRALRAAIERRVAADDARREQLARGLGQARAALAAARSVPAVEQGGLW